MTAQAAPEHLDTGLFISISLIAYSMWAIVARALRTLGSSFPLLLNGTESGGSAAWDLKAGGTPEELARDADDASTADDSSSCASPSGDDVGHLDGLSEASSDSGTEASCDGHAEQLRRALELQRDFLAATASPAFQSGLLVLLRGRAGPDAAGHLDGLSELCLSALREALPAHGFECTAAGLEDALRGLRAHAAESEELLDGLQALYDSLGRAPPPEVAGPLQGRGMAPWHT